MTERRRRKDDDACIQCGREGAREVLRELGIDSDTARDDIRELRSWMETFKVIRRTFTQTTVRMLTLGFWGLLLAGIVTKVMEIVGKK